VGWKTSHEKGIPDAPPRMRRPRYQGGSSQKREKRVKEKKRCRKGRFLFKGKLPELEEWGLSHPFLKNLDPQVKGNNKKKNSYSRRRGIQKSLLR